MTTSVQTAQTTAQQLAGFATTPWATLPVPVNLVSLVMDILVSV